jgi:hypothetical protein
MGFKYHLVGWGSQFQSLNDKLYGQLLALRDIPDETIVVFADAYDVLASGYPHEVVSRYRAFNAPVIFGAEKGCWPFIQFSVAETAKKITQGTLSKPIKELPPNADGQYLCSKYYPSSPTGQRYINSGVWIGSARHAKKFLHSLQTRLQQHPSGNDQEFVTYLYWENENGVELDFYSLLIKSMHDAKDDVAYGHRLWERNYQTDPIFWHFNGGGKAFFPDVERQMWYHRDQNAARKFWFDSSDAQSIKLGLLPQDFRGLEPSVRVQWKNGSFRDVCPKYVEKRISELRQKEKRG